MSSYRVARFGFNLGPMLEPPPIEVLAPPPRVYLPCLQHLGEVATPLVRIGQQLCRGQAIARNNNGLTIHASISGTLIERISMKLANGRIAPTLVIEQDQAEDETEERLLPAYKHSWQQLNTEQLLQRLNEAGIVGLGGAAFPSATKAAVDAHDCEFLILNGSECEPQMNCDQALMFHESERVIDGLAILQRICGARKLVIALREQQLAKRLQLVAKTKGLTLQIVCLPNRYTVGSEKVLIAVCSGRQIAVGSLPIDVGVLVFNVATSAAVADAVLRRQTLTSRIITLTVAASSRRHALKVRLGTSLDFIMEELQIKKQEIARLVVGGPMMGSAYHSFSIPVLKASTGFYLTKQTNVSKVKQQACIHCGDCLPVCPMGLQAASLFQLLASDQRSYAVDKGLMSCIECGACAAVCPSNIPLVHKFKLGKLQTRTELLQREANR